MDAMNSTTPKGAAKHDLLFNEPASGFSSKAGGYPRGKPFQSSWHYPKRMLDRDSL